ncbi:MAG: bifunctional riboflavin kinase/FAD synthetase [Anaerolineae bacterium]
MAWIKRDLQELNLDTPSAVTIGAFDGVHRGHRALIQKMVAEAERRHWAPVVVTFDPVPAQALDQNGTHLLTSLEERIHLVESLGVAGILTLTFDQALMETPAEHFVQQLVDHLRLSGLWIGPDFTLGKDRQGDINYLSEAGHRLGFETHVLYRTILWEGRPVRSSRIREALKRGDIDEANGCLGYPYHLTGTVEHGDKRGRELGFPTANLRVPEKRLLPADGVYVCCAHVGDEIHGAIANIGTRPTFDHAPRSVEAYLLDFAMDIYGSSMQLDFLKHLRPEKRFLSADALVAQMHRDEAEARAWLKETSWCEEGIHVYPMETE